MIKISANVSKKLPIAGMDYSSQQFGAAIEIEVSDADKAEDIQARIGELYALLSSTIDGQLGLATPQDIAPRTAPYNGRIPARQAPRTLPSPTGAPQSNGRYVRPSATANGNGRSLQATQAQQRAIFAICKAQGIALASVLADFNVADAKDLHVKDASRLIDELKARQAS